MIDISWGVNIADMSRSIVMSTMSFIKKKILSRTRYLTTSCETLFLENLMTTPFKNNTPQRKKSFIEEN